MSVREVAMSDRALGRMVARVLAAACAGGCVSCGPSFPCINGKYAPSTYVSTVRPVPPALRGAIPRVPGEPWCREACERAGACQVATVHGSPDPHVVCHEYWKGGCPSGWGSGRAIEGLE